MYKFNVANKIDERITVWYIKDGRQKFCCGILRSNYEHDYYVDVENLDGDIVRINKSVIYNIECE